MKNVLNYYYDIDLNHISYADGKYKFNANGERYIFSEFNRNDNELNEIYIIYNELHNMKIQIHEIVLNKFNDIITIYNRKRYVLLKMQIQHNELITFNDIIKFSQITKKEWDVKYIKRTQWDELWSQKNDFFEYQISQFGKKYSVASQIFSYYNGLIENSIQLFNQYNNDIITYSVCHKRINTDMTFEDFYNPLNFIIDYSIRDVAEFLKSRMFIDDDVYSEIKFFLKFYLYNESEMYLFFIRLFFPSNQLDILENIFSKRSEETIVYNIINLKYEKYIKKIYELFQSYIYITKIEWLD